MDAETCLKKLGYVGVLAFATVDESGGPQVRNISAIHYEWRDLIFEEQPYLSNVYPGDTRDIGIIFCIRDFTIEYFNLGVSPIFRESYAVGGGQIRPKGYEISAACIGCGACRRVCPQEPLCDPAGELPPLRQLPCTLSGAGGGAAGIGGTEP